MKDDFSLLFLAFFLIWLLGHLFRRLFAREDTTFLGMGQWAVDFGLGTGLLGFWLLLTFHLLGRIYFQSVYYLLLLLFILLILHDKKQFFKDYSFTIPRLSSLKKVDLYCVLLWIFLIQIIWFVWSAAYYDSLEWDTWFGYGFYAKAFFIDKSIYTRFMFDPGPHIFSIINYRYLLSLTDAWILYVLDGTWDHVYSFMTVMFYLAILSLIYSTIKQYVSPFMALLVTLLVASLEQAMHLGSTGMSDLVLAFYIFAGCLFFYRWLLTQSPSAILLSSIFFVSGALVKNEGVSMIAIATIVIWLYILFNYKTSFKTHLRHALLFTGGVLVGFIPWLFTYYKSLSVHPVRESYTFTNTMTLGIRFQMIWEALVKEWTNMDTWGLVWAFIALGIGYMILRWTKGQYKIFRWVWLLVGLQGLSYLLIHLTHPGDLAYFLSKTPYRLLFHLTPVLVFLSLVPWKEESK